MSEQRFFVSQAGDYIGSYCGDADVPFADAIEVKKAPKHALDKWSFSLKKWIPYEPPAEEKRKAAYTNELGNPGDQFDAIFKAVSILVPELVKRGAISPEIAAALLPDPNAPVDTPPGWLGKLSEIKARYPKERDSNV